MSLAEKIVIGLVAVFSVLVILEFACWHIDRKRAEDEDDQDETGDDDGY